MKLTGSYEIKLDKNSVWKALNDPEILKKSINKDFKFISGETLENLKKNSSNIFEYKGNNKLSSIAFIKKLN